MVRSAQQYARQHFHTEATNAYMATLLRGYAALLKYKPTLTPEYKEGRATMSEEELGQFVARTGLRTCPHWRNK